VGKLSAPKGKICDADIMAVRYYWAKVSRIINGIDMFGRGYDNAEHLAGHRRRMRFIRL
jgi:hypothetical protein